MDWRDGEETPRDWGTIFRQLPSGAREILHRFDGTGPTGCGTVRVSRGDDGALYGVGQSCWLQQGTAIFRLDGTSFEILQEFPVADFSPRWMVAGSNGAFYGVANVIADGFHRQSLFKWDGDITPLRLLTEAVSDNLVLGPDGSLYFTTRREHFVIELFDGTVQRITPDDQIELVYTFVGGLLGGGSAPAHDLIVGSDGLLYGTRLWRYVSPLPEPDLYAMALSGQLVGTRPSGGAPPLAVARDRSVFLVTDGYTSISRLTGADELEPVHTFSDGIGASVQLVEGPDGHFMGSEAPAASTDSGCSFASACPASTSRRTAWTDQSP